MSCSARSAAREADSKQTRSIDAIGEDLDEEIDVEWYGVGMNGEAEPWNARVLAGDSWVSGTQYAGAEQGPASDLEFDDFMRGWRLKEEENK